MNRRLPGGRQPYVLLVGVVIGLLIAGVVVPSLFGESLDESGDVETVAGGSDTGTVTTLAGEAATPGAATGGAATAAGETGLPGDGGTTGDAGGGGGTSGAGGDTSGGGVGAVATTAPAPGVTTPGAPLRATDVGVTPSTIKVGFLLLDVGSISRFGISVSVDPEQQKRAFQIFVDDINARGGINGRKVQTEFRTFDVLSQDDQRAACLELTRDKKVFAVIAPGGFFGPPILCVTEENKTLLISAGNQGTPSHFYQRSGGRLFSAFPSGNRQMGSWVAELDRLGLLKGKTIGVVGDDLGDPGGYVVDQGLVPALKQFGHSVAHRSRLSADLSVAASQIPVEVQQMRSKGVNYVLLATTTLNATQFVQNGDSQLWNVGYTVTDWQSMGGDTGSQNMPERFEGSTLITTARTGEWRVNKPEPKEDAACRQLYERKSGEKIPRNDGEDSNAFYTLTVANCGLVRVFEDAARGAGPVLTRAAASAAVERLGPRPWPNGLGGSFGPGKHDLADYVRTAKWYANCKCWKPVDEPRKMRF